METTDLNGMNQILDKDQSHKQLFPVKTPFDILSALLDHNDEALMIAEFLSPQDVENIYTVSKTFRIMFENDKTRFMRILVKNHAFYAYNAFPPTYNVRPLNLILCKD